MTDIPSPEKQCQLIKDIEKNSISVGEQVCPISSSWYSMWKKHVSYDYKSGPSDDPLDPIDNSNIIKDEHLDQNSIEYFNYYLIHKQSYDLLQQWYSGGPTIVFDVISDNKGKPVVPTKIFALKLYYNDKEELFEGHRYMKISEVHQKARQIFEIPETMKTRLVDFFNHHVTTIFDDSKYIQDYPLISGEQVLLDYEKEDSKSWYSEGLKNTTYSPILTPPSSPPKTQVNKDCAGVVGFSNLGNTCFFNSGTQCLMHTVPFISQFILNDDWENDLNYTNKIGMRGELAKAFAALAKKVWSGEYERISPSKLKHVIGRFRDAFSGYEQQDSHELIYAMLDGIHEDLNRIVDKPITDSVEGDGTNDSQTAIESWKRYKMRNDSIVVDIFDGLVRSRLICPDCNSTTIVFDPYRSITMPISKPHTKKIKVIFVPFNFFEKRQRLKIEISSSPEKDFNEAASKSISKIIGRNVNVKLAARTYAQYPLKWSIKYIASSTATVYAYEFPEKVDENSLFMMCSLQIDGKYGTYSQWANALSLNIAIPFIVDVSDLPGNFDSDDENKAKFEEKVEDRLKKLWEPAKPKGSSEEEEEEEADEFVIKFKKKMDLQPPATVTFSSPTQKLVSVFKGKIDIEKGIKVAGKTSKNVIETQAYIYLNEDAHFSIPSLLSNIQESTDKKKESQQDATTLDACFEYFSVAEVLDENNQWYCPHCKKFVCAEKKLDIWQVPKILIIQLKRFYGSGWSTRKLDKFVDFPEILDMKKYVIGPQKDEEGELKYRLYAVSNQYGSLGGGHYTAYARVRDPNDNADKGWYDFDDSYVSKSSEHDAHSSAAYVLFYERIEE